MHGMIKRAKRLSQIKLLRQTRGALAGAEGAMTVIDHPKKVMLPVWLAALEDYSTSLAMKPLTPSELHGLFEINTELRALYWPNGPFPILRGDFDSHFMSLAEKTGKGWRGWSERARYIVFGE